MSDFAPIGTMVASDKAKARFHLFDSPDAMRSRALAVASDTRAAQWRDASADEFQGYVSWSEAMARLQNGNTALVKQADAMLSELQDMVGFEARKFETQNSVVGGVPNVGAYLAGAPANMRLRRRVLSEQAPLIVVVETTCVWDVTAKQIQARGCAALALTQVLAMNRPVQLYTCSAFQYRETSTINSMTLCRIDSAPLDLGRACHMLTCPSVARRVGWAIHGTMQPTTREIGGIPLLGGSPDTARALTGGLVAAALGAAPEDVLYCGPAWRRDPLIDNPTAWLRDMIAKHGRTEA